MICTGRRGIEMRPFIWLFAPLFGLLAGFSAGAGFIHPDLQIVPILVSIVLIYALRMLPEARRRA